MKNVLTFILLYLFCILNVFAEFTDGDKAILNLNNLYTNGGAEKGKVGWSETGGGTLALETTTKRSGKAAIKFTSSATSDYLNFPAVIVKKGTNNCEAIFYYKTTSSVWDAEVYINSNRVALLDLPSNTEFTKASVTFVCTDFTNNTQVKLTNGAASDIVYVDDAEIGENRNLGTVAQAQFVGQITWPATTSCIWNLTNQTTLASFSEDSDCTTPTGTNLTGIAQAPSTKIPAITLPYGKKGRYVFVATGTFQYGTSANAAPNIGGAFKFYDGTSYSNNSKSISELYTLTTLNTGEVLTNTVIGEFDEEAFTNKTFEIRGMTPSSANAYVGISNNADTAYISPLTISVYYYPSASEQVVRAENANQFGALEWTGVGSYFSGGNGANLTYSTTRPSPTYTYGVALTDATNNLSIKLASLNPGTYKITIYGRLNNTGTGVTNAISISDGTTNKYAGLISGPSGDYAYRQSVVAYFNYTSLQTNIVFTANNSNGSGTLACDSQSGSCGISIEPVYPSSNLPQIINSVSTTYQGQTVLNSAYVQGACTSSPCTVVNSTGNWISSVTRGGTGAYTVNFVTGIFPNAPVCVIVADSSEAAIPSFYMSAPTNSSFSVYIRNLSGVAQDGGFSISCHGNK